MHELVIVHHLSLCPHFQSQRPFRVLGMQQVAIGAVDKTVSEMLYAFASAVAVTHDDDVFYADPIGPNQAVDGPIRGAQGEQLQE